MFIKHNSNKYKCQYTVQVRPCWSGQNIVSAHHVPLCAAQTARKKGLSPSLQPHKTPYCNQSKPQGNRASADHRADKGGGQRADSGESLNQQVNSLTVQS